MRWLALLLLAGCASNPVQVPIPVPCVTELPARPEACEPTNETRPEYLRCVLVDCERNKGYTKQLEAVLIGCQGETK